MVALSGEPMSLLDFDQRISRTQGRLVIASCLRVLEHLVELVTVPEFTG